MKRVGFLVPAMLLIALSPALAVDDDLSPGQWREKEKLGMGFGMSSAGTGLRFYLDYNFRPDFQLHFDTAKYSPRSSNGVSYYYGETSVAVFTASLRYFPDDSTGWFLGGGTGYGRVEQVFDTNPNTRSTATFVPVFFDGGWQGWDAYYFTINVQLGANIAAETTDNTGNIPDTYGGRAQAHQEFNRARLRGANGIQIGFGWYFPAPTKRKS